MLFKIIDGNYNKIKCTEIDICPRFDELGQREFDNAILNTHKYYQPDYMGINIVDAVEAYEGFSKIKKLLKTGHYKYDYGVDCDNEKLEFLRYQVNTNDKKLFPNLFKKLLRTGFINFQTEEDALEIYTKDRWDSMSKRKQKLIYNWDGDQPEPDNEDDK